MDGGAFVIVRDNVIWATHIHGNNELKKKILALKEGVPIRVTVDGFQGYWVKMSDGADGRPTPGIKPIGPAQQHWQKLQSKRGEPVPIC